MSSLMQRIRGSETRWCALAMVACLWLAAGAEARAQAASIKTTITTRTNHYILTGSTLTELLRSMQQARPWGGQASHSARTLWDATYRYSLRQTEAGFAPASLDLRAKVQITLPFWRMPEDAPAELREQWMDYLRALYTHEEGHLEIMRRALAEMEQRFADLGAYPTANQLRRAIAQVRASVLEQARRQEAEYDARTRHGITQGAVLRVPRGQPPAGPVADAATADLPVVPTPPPEDRHPADGSSLVR